jgi:RNA polymerase sigma factor (sigma-70 family)
MAETPVSGRNVGGSNRRGTAVTDDAVSAWFVAEIMPLEASLMNYLQHNWRNASDIADLRQEVYARVFEAAQDRVPDNPKHFLLACARNLLIDLVRREQVVPIEAIADIEGLNVATDAPQPDRSTIAREELRQLKGVLGALPARAREAITLAYFEGLTGKEIAARMGVTKSTASKHLAHGMHILTDLLHGLSADRGAKP